MTRILGIDPGLAHTGYGIIQIHKGKYRYLAHGVITTPASESTGRRLSTVYRTLCELIEEYRPTEAGIEALFFARNITSALPVAQAKGVILLALEERNIPCREYPPQAIKQAVVGRGRADKRQVQELVRILLGMNNLEVPDHASDALGAAICHYHTCESVNLIERSKGRGDV
jgi:crossover junction endodeoxyribonuclease RuvC